MTRQLAIVLVAIGFLAGCGDDDDAATGEEDAAAGVEETGETGETGEEAGAGDGSVTIQDFAFEPASIDVAAGTAITWTNEDGTTHTVTSGTPGEADGTFDQSVERGASVEITLEEAGTISYFCAIHPSMTGEIVVS